MTGVNRSGGGAGGGGGGAPLTGATTLAGAVGGAYATTVGFRGPGIGITIPASTTRDTLARYDTAANALPVGTGVDSATDGPQFGTNTVRIIVPQGNTVALYPRFAANFSVVPVDVTDKLICLRIKFIPNTTAGAERGNVGAIRVRLYTDASPNPAAANYLEAACGTLDRGDTLTGEWQTIRIPIEVFSVAGTIPDVPAFMQAIRYAAVSVTHNGNTSATFRIGLSTITAEPGLATKGMVILSFDDCRLDTFTYAASIMARYGFPGVLYPGNIREALGKDPVNRMDINQVRFLQEQGWQIASQAWSSEAPAMSADLFTGEMSELHNYYVSLGLTGSVDGSYFSSVGYGSIYQDAFEKSFRTMRNYTQFSELQQPRPESCPPSERFLLKCFGVNTVVNSATNSLIPYAQRSADTNGCAIYSWHGLSSGDTKIAADGGVLTSFEKFLEWLDLNRDIIDVVTTDTWVRRMGAK